MLKIRVIPVLLVDGPSLVKGIQFDNWRRVGTLPQAIKVFNARDVDELILIDVAGSRRRKPFDHTLLDQVYGRLFTPLTVGGGLSSVEDAARAIEAGADKVVIGSAGIAGGRVISEVADRFGSQAVVGSIDVRHSQGGEYRCFAFGGSVEILEDVTARARMLENSGVGEIIVTSIDNDGTMLGFDCELISAVATSVTVPVIAAGGAGNSQHFVEAFTAGAAAAAAGSIFQFTHVTPSDVRDTVSEAGFPVRQVMSVAQ